MSRDAPVRLTRRRLLAAGAAAAGGLALPHLATGAAPAGLPLPDYPEIPVRRVGATAHAALKAAPCAVEVAGREVELLCYNGMFPGPLLRLRQDETAAIDFGNALGAPTNLHTHGLTTPPEGSGDNPFLRIAPGERFAYAFPLGGDPRNCGLFWYHPHHHGTDARQLFGGLAGPLVVEGPDDPGPLLGAHDERVLVLKDLKLGSRGLVRHRPIDWLMGLEGDLSLVNGLVEPVLEARERRLRLRLLNASNAKYWSLEIPGAEALSVIALDGHVCEAPLPVRSVTLVPGQRADLVVDLPRNSTLQVLDRPVARRAAFGRSTRPIMTIRLPEHGRAAPAPLPRRLAPPADESREIAARREVVLSLFYICGRAYGGPGAEPLFRPRLGSRELWSVVNADSMDHPFHLHTWPFRVLRLNGHEVPGRPMRDTVNLRPGDRAELCIDFDRLAGKSMFHCHIAEHAAKGMMETLEVTT